MRRDEGSATVLTVGLLAVLLAVVVTVASVTHLQLQRARLAHAADEVALAAADAIDLDAYYADGAPAGAPLLDPARVRSEAERHLALASARQGLEGAVLTSASSPDGATAEVTLALRSPLVLGAPWLPGRVDLSARASARADVP